MANEWYQNNMNNMRGYQNINKTGTQAWPEYDENYGSSFAGIGRFDPNNLMRPSNLTQDMGASMYTAPVNQSTSSFLPDQGNVAYAPEEKKGMFTGFANALLKKLPRQDPRQIALTKFYGGKGNLQGGQTIQGGLMAGYNPVSGGLLNKFTGGKFGQPTNYGLQRAYDKRIGTLDKTLGSLDEKWSQLKEDEPAKFAEKQRILTARLRKLQADKAAELEMLGKVPTTGEGGPVITDGSKTGDNIGGSGNTGGGYHISQQLGITPTQAQAVSQANKDAGYSSWGGLAHGGRAGYEGGELVDEDINIEGPGFDVNENIEMAGGEDPMLVEQYQNYVFEMEEQGIQPMSFEDFKIQALSGMAEGQEDSFSEEGIASLV